MINLDLLVYLNFNIKKILVYLNFILIYVISWVIVVKCNWFYVKKNLNIGD